MTDALSFASEVPDDAADGANTRSRIPVALVTGFLGSGKTTLVNRLMRSSSHARSAVIVNEYGEVSVDHLLINAPRRRMRIIDGGCQCGHVHEEVATSLLDLEQSRQAGGDADFDRVLIETSGLADPVPIIQILLTDPLVTRSFELRVVVTVADGVNGRRQLREHPESVKQAATADVLVVSKSDLADAGEISALRDALTRMNPGAALHCAIRGELDPGLLEHSRYALSGRTSEARSWLTDPSYAASTPAPSEDPSIRTFTLTYNDEITTPGFVLWMNLLAGFRGAGLLRVKGIVNVEGKPYAVQAVQTILSEPVLLDDWPEGHDRQSRLVFITRGMDEAQVRNTFAAFQFEGGRARRNLVIHPETFARFRETMQLFRQS